MTILQLLIWGWLVPSCVVYLMWSLTLKYEDWKYPIEDKLTPEDEWMIVEMCVLWPMGLYQYIRCFFEDNADE